MSDLGTRRAGFSGLILVLAAAVILLVWGIAQQFVTGSAERRVRLAEVGRRCLLQASSAVDEGIDLVHGLANGVAAEDADSLGRRIRELAPGQVLELAYRPMLTEEGGEASGERIVEARIRAWVQRVEPERGWRPPEFSCERYLEAWRDLLRTGASPLRIEREERELMGSWTTARVLGILELSARSEVTVSRVVVSRRVTSRRQYLLSLSPCPQGFGEATGSGHPSVLRIHPVEVARLVERPLAGGDP